MKKIITNLFAKVAMVAGLAVLFSVSAWAADGDEHNFSQTLSQLLNNNASIPSIDIAAQSYPVKKIVVSYRYNKTIKNAVTVEVSVGGTSWGSESVNGTGSNYSTLEFSGEAVTGAISISFTNNTGNGTGHGTFYVNNVQLVEGASSGPSTPSISADNVNIAYSAEGGSIAYTLDNGVDGGSISAAVTEGDWLTLGQGTASPISFTCSANSENTQRTATVRITYTYNTDKTVTKDVTVTQAAAPVIYTTIPELFNAATGTATNVFVTFNNWVVSGVSTNGKNVFVTDNNGNGFVIYGSDLDNTYSVGNILSGTAVPCSLQLYSGFAELLNLDAADLTITTGGTVSPANVELANLSGVNTGALLHYENLTCSVSNNKYYVSDGNTTLQVYEALYTLGSSDLEDGKMYNITGIYQQYNKTMEILPRSADDIEEVVVTTPSITVTPNAINATCAETDGSIAIAYEYLTISDPTDFEIQFYSSTDEEISMPSWIDVEVNEDEKGDYSITYMIGANDGEARTAYFKVYAMDDETNLVYSNLVTVNQAQFVIDYATLPFAYDGNGTSTLPAGFTVSGTGTYTSSPKIKFDGTGDYVILKINQAPGTLTFNVKGNGSDPWSGTFTVQTSEDGITYTDLESYTELSSTVQTKSFSSLGENVRYIKWVYTKKGTGNVGLGNINLYPVPSVNNVPATLNNGKYWATFYNSSKRFVLPEGALAFTMNNSYQLYQLGTDGSIIPANTAVIIIADSDSIVLNEVFTTSSISINGESNVLLGSDVPVAVSGISGTPYVMGIKDGVIGFYQYTGANIPAAKAYYIVNE